MSHKNTPKRSYGNRGLPQSGKKTTSQGHTQGQAKPTPIVLLSREFTKQIAKLYFSYPVEYIYNPLAYAQEPYENYLNQYGQGEKKVLFVGMNPGPWGMVQTGIPFGEITFVKEWLHIEGLVNQPVHTHPKRPVDGFQCKRHEPSGKRLWGLMQSRFHTANTFFKEHFVANYCPLAFFDSEGKNITPDKLVKQERTTLLNTCNIFLGETIKLLQPLFVIGIGQFAFEQISDTIKLLALEQAPGGIKFRQAPDKMTIGKILHPSPSNPAANTGWAEKATTQLIELGVWKK